MLRLLGGCCLLLALAGCSPNASENLRNPTQPALSNARPCAPSTAALDSLVHDSMTVSAPAEIRTVGAIDYPPTLRDKHIEGIVVLRVWLASTGTVDSVSIDSASDVGFIGAAVASVLHGSYWPACVGARPVRYTALLPVRFRLGTP